MQQLLLNLIYTKKCIHCNSRCNSDQRVSRSGLVSNIKTFYITCTKCNEIVRLHFLDYDKNNNRSKGFAYGFSYKNLYIRSYRNYDFYKYFESTEDQKLFFIGIGDSIIEIPRFEINETNKHLLFDKLKTYTLFS